MPENMDTKNTALDSESQEAQDKNLEKSSHNDAPFAAPNLPVPVRQSYVSHGFGIEAFTNSVRFVKAFLKKCIKPLDTDRNREFGEAAVRTAAKGFSDSFAGVACALSDLKEAINKKSPRSAAMLNQAGETAKTISEKIKNAPADVAPKLKELKESESFEAAKEKISKSMDATNHTISVSAEVAGNMLKKVAQDTSVFIDELKDKAALKKEEPRTEKIEDEPVDTEVKTPSDSEPEAGIAKVVLDKAGEKLQSLNQFAGTGVSNEHEQSELSKKIDEQLNKLGSVVSKKSAELTKGPLGKAGEKILLLGQQAGTTITECLQNGSLQKKLSENIKNLGDTVTKMDPEEKVKKIADEFSDKAKTLADSARQKAEDIYKTEDDTGTKNTAELSEKIADLKDKIVENALDLKEQVQEKIDALRASRETESAKVEPVEIELPPASSPVLEARKSRVQSKFSASAAKFRATNPRVRKILCLYGPVPRTKARGRAKSHHQSAKSAYAARIAAKWTKTQNKMN